MDDGLCVDVANGLCFNTPQTPPLTAPSQNKY